MEQFYHKLPPWITDAKGYINYYNVGQGTEYVVLDVETEGDDYGSATNPDANLVLACWAKVREIDGVIQSIEYKWKFGDEYSQQELVNDVMECRFVVAHNAKYDIQWLKRCGVDLHDIYPYCTMLGEWVLAGNRRIPKDLASTAKRYGTFSKKDSVSALIKAGVPTSLIPRSWLKEYCLADVRACLEIYRTQRVALHAEGLMHLAHTRNMTCAVLADIEFNGLTLDGPAVEEEYAKTVEEHRKAGDELRAIAGDGVNFNSGKQLAALLYEKLGFSPPIDPRTKQPVVTKGGVLSTDSGTLSKLRAVTDDQVNFLKAYKNFNKLSALLTKNLEFFVGVVREYGSKFFTIFNQGSTKTGRLSASGRALMFRGHKKPKGVQGQNLPRQYKRLFWSGDEEMYTGEADAAQLEFRVGAALGNDKVAIKEIDEGVDVHSITAQVLTEAGEPTTRQQAKASTFSPLYGGMGATKAQQEYAAFFKSKYSGISLTQRGWALTVLATGELRAPYGIKFYWPDTKLTKSGYITNSTEIYNFNVQGLATGEIIPLVLVHFWHIIRGTKFTIVNTIHDSIITLFPKSETEFYEQASKFCFTDAIFPYLRDVYGFEFTAPLGAGIKFSRNWGQSDTEIIYNVRPDGTFTRKEK